MLSVRIPKPLYDALPERGEQGRMVSEPVRNALDAYLTRHIGTGNWPGLPLTDVETQDITVKNIDREKRQQLAAIEALENLAPSQIVSAALYEGSEVDAELPSMPADCVETRRRQGVPETMQPLRNQFTRRERVYLGLAAGQEFCTDLTVSRIRSLVGAAFPTGQDPSRRYIGSALTDLVRDGDVEKGMCEEGTTYTVPLETSPLRVADSDTVAELFTRVFDAVLPADALYEAVAAEYGDSEEADAMLQDVDTLQEGLRSQYQQEAAPPAAVWERYEDVLEVGEGVAYCPEQDAYTVRDVHRFTPPTPL